jgi:phosphate transport system ATP-binding protein
MVTINGTVRNNGNAELTTANGRRGVVEVETLNAWYGDFLAIKNVSLKINSQIITAIIGPSGCGKSTLIRCLNRMHEVSGGGRVAGRVLVDGQDIYGNGIDPVAVRRRIGMVFQKPTPFPTMTVFDNVAAGLRLTRFWSHRSELEEVVERSLRHAALWDEVKDKLDQSGASLSGGQQQRLCIARAIAVQPEIILLDEPCSALDPVATLKIEDLMRNLAREYTIVIVTHNMQQAARVSDMTAFMLMDEDRAGILVEYGATSELFANPRDKRTEDYITGRFG